MQSDRHWLGQELVRTRAKIARAREEHLEALEAFVAAGGTYSEAARLLGVTRQAVRQTVERGRQQ